MLLVTCILTCEGVMVDHEVQVWHTALLNCIIFLYDLIKRRQLCYKAVSPVTFAPVDFRLLSDLQILPQLPRGCMEVHKLGKKGGLYPFSHFAVAHNYSGVLTQIFSDLMQERKWLMRSDSPICDAGLPGSKGRRCTPPWATSLNSFPICAPLTLSLCH